MSIIELKGVTKEYGQGHTLVQALKPTDFRLEAGQFVAIIGPSGSGKTTFLTLLGHLQTPSKDRFCCMGKILPSSRKRNELLYASMILALFCRLPISFLF